MNVDAVIIGAGIIGCAVGLNLARKGYKTVNIDALPGPGYGSTSSSCGIIRVYYSTVDATALAYEGYFDWQDWRGYLEAPAGEDVAEFLQTGTLVMKTAANGHMANVIANVSKLGIPYEEWDAAQIEKAMPGYNLASFSPAKTMDSAGFGESNGGRISGGVYFPAGGYVPDPQFATRNLKDACERAGGKFLFNRKVLNILTEAGRVSGVELDDGTTVTAPIIVNVAGPHSGKINALVDGDLGMAIKTRPLRQEVVQVNPPESLGYSRTGLIVSDSDISAYIRPVSAGKLMIGSENPPCDAPQEVDPDDFARNTTDRALTLACRYAQRLPELGIPQSPQGLADLYDASDDWLPIYDRSGVDGYYMAIGTSGNQFKNAPLAGKIMTEVIDFCENGGDHDAEPVQFDLARIGHRLDTSSFSRKRKLTEGSSFSVLG